MTDLGPGLLDWIDRLYQIDPEWRVREPRSLTWWPFTFRQQITADLPRNSVGEQLTRLTATTPFLTDVADSDVTYQVLLAMNYVATFSALVYEPERRIAHLQMAASFYEGNRQWLQRLFGSAAILQVAVPQGADPNAFAAFGTLDVAVHPASGPRPVPDEMLTVVSQYQEGGRGSNAIQKQTYDAAAAWLNEAGFKVSGGRTALDVAVPTYRLGDSTQIHVDDSPHPGFGTGVFVLVTAPALPGSPDLYRKANDLNRREISVGLDVQSFGAWTVGADGLLHHVAFYPNLLFANDDLGSKANLLVNIALNEVVRCKWLDGSWDQPGAPTA